MKVIMVSRFELEQMILEKNLTIVQKKEHNIIRKDRANTIDKSYSFECKCPREGCSNSFNISRVRDLDRTCRSCSIKGTKKEDKQVLEWLILTDDINQATTSLAKANPKLFIREEYSDSHKRVILKCSTPDCNGEVSTNSIGKTKAFRTKCKRCSQKSRPYERTYNLAKNRANKREIKWLLSYDEFSELCSILNCHYCNVTLNRAKHRNGIGSTQPLLDRKDSNKDYTLDNCVPCCPDCNFTKHEHITYEEMVLIMKYRGCWVEIKEGYTNVQF
jgi:hypothetical protein